MVTSQCSDSSSVRIHDLHHPSWTSFICAKYLSHIRHELQRKCETVTARDTEGNCCVQNLKSSKPVFSDTLVWAQQPGTVWMNSDRQNALSSHCPWRCGLANVRHHCKHNLAQHVSRAISSKVNSVTEWLSLRNVSHALTLNLMKQIKSRKLFFILFFSIVVSKWDEKCYGCSWGPG